MKSLQKSLRQALFAGFAISVIGLSSLSGLTGCSAAISGEIKTDGSADLNLRAKIEPKMAALIRSFSNRAGSQTDPDAPLINANAINNSLGKSPGIKSIALKSGANQVIEGPVQITQIDQFLSQPALQGAAAQNKAAEPQFIRWQQNADGGKLIITLNRKTSPNILTRLSPDVADYLSAFFAPAATGEELTKAEYLNLIEESYGKAIAAEISAARFSLALTLPARIKKISGGTSSARRATFDIPLVDLLVLEKELRYEVEW